MSRERFTGWTIKQPQRDPEFTYDDRIHDKGTKFVLGHEITRRNEGREEVLDILGARPAHAHHISFEIAQRSSPTIVGCGWWDRDDPDVPQNRMAIFAKCCAR